MCLAQKNEPLFTQKSNHRHDICIQTWDRLQKSEHYVGIVNKSLHGEVPNVLWITNF